MSFIKLDRKIMKWKHYRNPEMLMLWVHLLLSAEYEEKMVDGMLVQRGQLITGRKKLAEETGLSENKIRGLLNHLQKDQQITIKSTNRFSLITILKYDEFQGRHKKTTSKSTDKPPAKQPLYKEYKEVKKERNIYIDTLPTYDPSGNVRLDEEEVDRLLKLKGGEA